MALCRKINHSSPLVHHPNTAETEVGKENQQEIELYKWHQHTISLPHSTLQHHIGRIKMQGMDEDEDEA
jgi:hypothetical protein